MGKSAADDGVEYPRSFGVPADPPRLNDNLDRLKDRRLGLVVAPAGSGKTSLLVQFALAAETPVAWCRSDMPRPSWRTLARRSPRRWAAPDADPSVEGVVQAIEESRVNRLLLLLDDLHVPAGSDAEPAFQRLLD